MNILDIVNPSQTFLVEANLLNVSDAYEGFSLQKYLKHYAKSIKTPIAQKMFVKKLQKLLMNDPKYHFAVRELPSDAPPWAQEALDNRDLFYFRPDEDLNTIVEHITHYIAKMEEDMEQTEDNNKKTRATKEFTGFPKAENLSVIEKASDEYFARGAKSSFDTEGMKEMYTNAGFTWYKVNSVAAFKRAGDTLQNCIGSHYTKASCDRDGLSIIILTDSKGAMIVASRIKNESHEMVEMKGKNNKPPIKAYMPPVAALINKFKLKLSSSAHSDIMKTGYYYDEEDGKMLTKPQAIKKLVKFTQLEKLGLGMNLVEPHPANDSDSAKSIFYDLYDGVSQYSRNDKVYEARAENGNPIIIAVVGSAGKVSHLNTFFSNRLHDETHLQEAIEESNKKEYFKLFINAIAKRGGITGFDSSSFRHVFWEVGLEWDSVKKKLVDRAEGADLQHEKKLHKWKKYVDTSTINSIQNTFELNYKHKIGTLKKVFVAKEEEANDRSRNDQDMYLVVLVDNQDDSYLTNISGEVSDEKHVGYKKEVDTAGYGHKMTRVSLDHKTITSIVRLAKEEKFHLPDAARARFGVTGDKPENYKQYKPEWKKVPGDPEAIKSDFSHLRDEDRFQAMYTTIMLELGGLHAKDLFGIHRRMSGTNDRQYFAEYNTHNVNHGDHWENHTPASAQKAIGGVDTAWKVDVGYGAQQRHGVMMLSSGSKITKIDQHTEEHKWQGWDDFDEVAKILNKFAADHHMVFANGAVTTDKRASTEFRIADGKLVTAQAVKSSELSRHQKKEGTDQIKFHDGYTLTRMTPDEQGKWIRRGIQDGVRGQGWLLEDKDKNKKMVLTILHQRIARMFYHWEDSKKTKDWPTSYGSKKLIYLPYIKQAIKQFGWKPSKTGVMKPKPINRDIRIMVQRLADKYPQGGTRFVKHNQDNYNRWEMDRFCEQGYMQRFKDRNTGRQSYQVTPSGTALNDQFNAAKKKAEKDGTSVATAIQAVSDETPISSAKTHKDWSMPAPAARPARPAARAAGGGGAARPARVAPGGGQTKASLALVKFQDHVEAEGEIPTRGEFIAYMEEDPFNMTKTGAQTYYYTTKKKYAALQESVLGDLAKLLLVEPDVSFTGFGDLVIE